MLAWMWRKRLQTDETTVEISMEGPPKSKVDLPYDPAELLGAYIQRTLHLTTETFDYLYLLLLYSQ